MIVALIAFSSAASAADPAVNHGFGSIAARNAFALRAPPVLTEVKTPPPPPPPEQRWIITGVTDILGAACALVEVVEPGEPTARRLIIREGDEMAAWRVTRISVPREQVWIEDRLSGQSRKLELSQKQAPRGIRPGLH